MQRRNLIRLAFAGAASGILMPKVVLAKADPTSGERANPMAGGLFYTKDAPGRWKGKEKGHVPIIETGIDRKSGKVSVQVATGHEMKGFDHYIIKHILLDGDYRFLAEKMFDPAKDKAPISNFSLETYSGPIFAISVCNKHDTWLGIGKV
uniref:Superoxide reductase n=1 Tax=Candidatus Kentrum sp. SD TaxID=2126332 RepID=A0A450YF02_9GAMM|nr:MAG: superoxide reductase [Candidatus Kentron sp. SD]VFK45439.1 MAG: superoxide reductase [Candidatus Kentron sp. SD]